MFSIKKWDFLYPAGIDFSSFKHRMFHETHARINIRPRIHLEQVGYDELSSSEVDEPVGDDGDAFSFQSVFYKYYSNSNLSLFQRKYLYNQCRHLSSRFFLLFFP